MNPEYPDKKGAAPENRPSGRDAVRGGHRTVRTTGRTWMLAFLGGVLIALFLLSIQWKGSQRVTGVTVGGEMIFSEETILSRADVPLGELMDTVSLSGIRERLIDYPYIRDARASRTYPGTISIEIEERVPVVAFLRNGRMMYADPDGVVLPELKPEAHVDLPFVSGIPELMRSRVGSAIESEDYFEALGLIGAALETDSLVYRLISEVDMNDGGDIVIYSVDVAVPIKFGRGDAPRKFTLLLDFWTRFVLDEGPEKLEYLDLRFDDQVVAKWNTKPRKQFNQSSL